jgi:hypothetical protein
MVRNWLRPTVFNVDYNTKLRSLGSSVGIATGHGLEGGVRSPRGTSYFSPFLRVQTGPGAHPAARV